MLLRMDGIMAFGPLPAQANSNLLFAYICITDSKNSFNGNYYRLVFSHYYVSVLLFLKLFSLHVPDSEALSFKVHIIQGEEAVYNISR